MGAPIAVSMMSPNPNQIKVYRGQTKDIVLKLTKPGCDPFGKPIQECLDLTGCTLYFTMRRRADFPETLISKISTDSTQISINVPSTHGVAVLHLLAVDTQFLYANTYIYDIWVRDASNNRFPVIELSEFIIEQPVTIIVG